MKKEVKEALEEVKRTCDGYCSFWGESGPVNMDRKAFRRMRDKVEKVLKENK